MTKDLDKKVARAMELQYERGFIDGMQKQMQSSVDKAVNRMAQTELCKYGQEPASCTSNPMDCQCAIDASLAQTQEPHGWYIDGYGAVIGTAEPKSVRVGEWLPWYTTPPQRTWVGLTDDEVFGLFGRFTAMTGKSWLDLYRMTEAKLKEKNT